MNYKERVVYFAGNDTHWYAWGVINGTRLVFSEPKTNSSAKVGVMNALQMAFSLIERIGFENAKPYLEGTDTNIPAFHRKQYQVIRGDLDSIQIIT